MNSNNYKGGFWELEGYISEEKFAEKEMQYEKTLKLINGYISFLQRAKQSQTLMDSSLPQYPITPLPNTSMPEPE